jgi:hypothetical protein
MPSRQRTISHLPAAVEALGIATVEARAFKVLVSRTHDLPQSRYDRNGYTQPRTPETLAHHHGPIAVPANRDIAFGLRYSAFSDGLLTPKAAEEPRKLVVESGGF